MLWTPRAEPNSEFGGRRSAARGAAHGRGMEQPRTQASESLAEVQVDDLEEEYDMQDELGQGSATRVFLALRSGKPVALKCVDAADLGDDEVLASIRTEIGILRKMPPHPHIVRLHRAVRDPQSLAIELEALEGGELFELLRVHHPPCTAHRAASPILTR